MNWIMSFSQEAYSSVRKKRQEENMMYGENNSIVLAYFKKSDCNMESSLTRKWKGVVRDKAKGCAYTYCERPYLLSWF